MPHGDFWTEDERKVTLSMLREGCKPRAIAHVLHKSKNSVIGKIHRDPDMASFRPGRPKRVERPKKHKTHAPVEVLPPAPPPPRPKLVLPPVLPKPAPLPVADIKPPKMWLRPLVELGASDCHYPAKDAPRAVGGVLYCGAHVRPGASYCDFHDAVMRGRIKPAPDPVEEESSA